MFRVALGSLVLIGLIGGSAAADRPRLELREGPAQPTIERAGLSGHTIFLNRCIGGCQLKPGDDDATTTPVTSAIVSSNVTVAEPTELTNEEWADTVKCVQEVYSPFAVNVTDIKPAAGTSYSAIIVGGTDAEPAASVIAPGAGGVAIVSSNCTPIVRGVSYAFAEKSNLDIFALEAGGDTSSKSRALGLCWVIAQETAHSMGLDHEFEYSDDKASACNDPMTYRDDCGGQKFFRNRFATCGEFPNDGVSPRNCKCGINQNSHLKLLSVFGEGTSTVPAPTAVITTPGASSTSANSMPGTIIASAGSARGVNRVELFVNGHKWAEVKGAPFQRNIGQPIPSSYSIQVPASLPNSIVDVSIKAYDDLEVVGESPVITLVKGPAGGCADASTCAEGQKCEAGKCFWDAPAGEVGDPCTFPEFCKSGQCSDTTIQDDGICTQPCVVGVADGCPMGLECIAVGNGGLCYTASDGGGCCSTSRDTPWAPLMLGAGILGFVVLRRRRK